MTLPRTTAHQSAPARTIRVYGHSPYTVVTPEPYESRVYPSRCAEIAEVMREQGFSEAAIAVGPGIVMAESGGRAEATAETPWERSLGPWQINLAVHRWVSDECARSLRCSTAVAWRLSAGGTRWTPWSVYNQGLHVGRCD